MRVTSNNLLDLARSIGQAVPEADDSELSVPNTIVPVVNLPYPYVTTTGVGGATVQRGSFVNRLIVLVLVGGGGVNTVMNTLSPGLWRLNTHVSMVTNYEAGGTAHDLEVILRQPSGHVFAGLFAAGAAGNSFAQNMFVSLEVLFDKQFTFEVFAPNNVAGQNLRAGICLEATRLM